MIKVKVFLLIFLQTLAARLLSWVGSEEVEHFLATVVQNLGLLTKRDTHDGRLPLIWPLVDRFFSKALAATLLSFGLMMRAQFKPQKGNFIPAVSSKVSSFFFFFSFRSRRLLFHLDFVLRDAVTKSWLTAIFRSVLTFSLKWPILLHFAVRSEHGVEFVGAWRGVVGRNQERRHLASILARCRVRDCHVGERDRTPRPPFALRNAGGLLFRSLHTSSPS